jgi:hypothetical protein
MTAPKQIQKVKRLFLPVDPNESVIAGQETVSKMVNGIIESETVQIIRHLDSGEQITEHTQLFRDPLTGSIVDAKNTFSCSACYQRFSLKSLGKLVQEENVLYCTQCWPEEKRIRRRKKVLGFLKVLWNA